jgi:xanthine/CO dehydrogenase XdhC/CoxF family maturation factor
MIVNDRGDFLGSVSGGCVEANVINECLELIKNKNLFKKMHFTVQDESAWSVGLACGGEMKVFIELIN